MGKKNDLSSEVKLELFNDQNPRGKTLKGCSPGQLDTRRDTKVVMHGFKSSGEKMKTQGWWDKAYKGKGVNLIFVDWKEMASLSKGRISPINLEAIKVLFGKLVSETESQIYTTAARNAIKVGKYLAQCLNQLQVNGRSLHLFGHSLGAHGVGMAGREMAKTRNKPARVTGMDPAGPRFVPSFFSLYTYLSPDEALKKMKIGKDSGSFVDIVHTNIGVFGAPETLGHVDYYVNGGGPFQPTCGSRSLVKSHANSHSYSTKVVVASIQKKDQRVYDCQINPALRYRDAKDNDYCTKYGNNLFRFDVKATVKAIHRTKFIDTNIEC